MHLPFFSRDQVSPAQTRAESSRTFEDVLLAEHRALFPTDDVPRRPYTLVGDDICDLQRLAEYFYEAALKDVYGEWVVSAGADGPRLALRARIWDTFPQALRDRLADIATHPDRERTDDADTSRQVAEALNAIIRGDHATALAK
jgi:hypothetical protein